MNAHVHTIMYHPKSGEGYAVCNCGATLRIENGKPYGDWHACDLCSTEPANPTERKEIL